MVSRPNFLTIDFEDWYQGLTSTSTAPYKWDAYEKRLEIGANWLLDALDIHGAKATFFIVGQVAREYPHLVRHIAEKGHSLALHGDRHQRICRMSREKFREDLRNNLEAIQNACGVSASGYRAPCFSITKQTTWFWEELAVHGLNFDSSVFPIRNPLYGSADAPRMPHIISTAHGPVKEFPMSTIRLLGVNLPFSGGFYFRALPYPLVRKLTLNLNREGIAVIFYFHPWEFDPDHPISPTTTLRERLSHYGWLRGTKSKFLKLLEDFKFVPMERSAH
ncbi:MAG: polysaccharide deacetylase family protein [Syntrophobacteraceae bacterium]